MTQRQHKYSVRKCTKFSNPKNVVEEYEKLHDPRRLLISNQDSHRLAALSCRARLINQSVNEYDIPYIPSFKDHQTDLNYLTATSENNQPKRKPVFPVYQSIVQQNFRWSPYVESSKVSQTDDRDNSPRYSCRCENCTSSNCPSRTSSSSTVKPRFKDNITTFSNKYTMTPRLNDVSCNVCKSLTYISDLTSDDSVSSAVKDSGVCNKDLYKYPPTSILKNCDYFNYDYQKPCKTSYEFSQEAVKDTDTGDNYEQAYEPANARPSRYANPKTKESKPCEHCVDRTKCSRKILYNEGISDSVTNKNPLYPRELPSPCNSPRYRSCSPYSKPQQESPPQYYVPKDYSGRRSPHYSQPREWISVPHPCDMPYESNLAQVRSRTPPGNLPRDCSRVSMRRSRSRCHIDPEVYIPYSHTGYSKYHRHCKESHPKPLYNHCDLRKSEVQLRDTRHVQRCPFARIPSRSPEQQCRPACISLPRKVLASEKNIESFIKPKNKSSQGGAAVQRASIGRYRRRR